MPRRPANSVQPATRADWRAWLAEHHQRSTGVWFVSYKASTGRPRVTYEEAVEEALCYGWIDSKGNRLDEARTMLWFAPRKAGTGWSRPNKERVGRLAAAGRMAPAGATKVAMARVDGSWSTLDAVEALEIPADLAKAFRRHRGSSAKFAAFPRSAKRGILEWIAQARRAETRAARVEETARLAGEGVRANQWRGDRPRDASRPPSSRIRRPRNA